MKLKNIYEFAFNQGVKADPRSKERIQKELDKIKEEFNKLEEGNKKYFDLERLKNPYADTRILNGTGDEDIKRILVGIDIEIGEILLADRLISRGEKIDLILSHHPEGKALANFYDVMHMQADILNKYGVPITIAEGMLEGRIKEVSRRVMPINHNRAVDAAKLLNIPFMCVHTPADNSVTSYLQNLMDEKKPDTLKEIKEILLEIPEYQAAAKLNVGPTILVGTEKNRAGKVFVDMTGGTGGSKEVFQKLANTEIGTIVGMHIGEEHYKEAGKHHINVVIAGHMASDTLGVNLLLDELMKREHLEIITCSGFTRVERN